MKKITLLRRSHFNSVIITILTLALVVGAGSAFSNAKASTILFDNGAYSGPQQNVRNTVSSQTMYDDFVLQNESVITGFEWMQHDHLNMEYESTEISIFEGLPEVANLIFRADIVANRSLNATGALFTNWIGYDYFVDGLSINLSAGIYFLGLNTNKTNIVFGDTSWDQTAGNASTIPGRYLINNLNPEPGKLLAQDSVFKVVGNAIVKTEFPWTMFMPAITGRSCRINSFWGAYSIVCCRSSSASFSVTISGKTKQSFKPACGVTATFEGWEKTSPGEKSVFWQLTSPTCGTYSGTLSGVMEKGKVYLFRLELENGKPIVYVYSGDACNVVQNSQITESQSLLEDTIGMETTSFRLVNKIRLDIQPDTFKINDLPLDSFQTVP